MKILITGATGLIGREVGIELARQGHQLLAISRVRHKALQQVPYPCEIIEGDLSRSPIFDPRLQSVDAVINLLGEGIADKRWSSEQKQKILQSRVAGTRNLVASFQKAPSVFVSASAVGIYGDRGDEILTEKSSHGQGFLSEVCGQWEHEAESILRLGPVKLIKARFGPILSQDGGALQKMIPAFKAGVGGPLGTGNQWMSWVHIQDASRLLSFLINHPGAQGVFNITSPEPVQNADLSRLLSEYLHRPKIPAMPKMMVKLALGELSEAVLDSQRVIPQRALELGFEFKFKNLPAALDDLLVFQKQREDSIRFRQYIPQKKEQLFTFFSAARNLEVISPDQLNLRVVGVSSPQIQEGTIIEYKLKIHGVPTTWKSQIREWKPPTQFADQAVKSPFKLWHHSHNFEDLGHGTLLTDQIRYVIPWGYLGWISSFWRVKKEIEQMFQARRKKMVEILEHQARSSPSQAAESPYQAR